MELLQLLDGLDARDDGLIIRLAGIGSSEMTKCMILMKLCSAVETPFIQNSDPVLMFVV